MSPPAVLLIGSTGFIGRRIELQLRDYDVQVRCLVRAETARRLGMPDQDGGTNPQLIVGDLTDRAVLSRALAGVNAVIYAAGSVRGRVPDDFETANVTGVAAVAREMQRAQAQARLLLISSLAASQPQLSHYARSKRLGEQALQQFAGLRWCVLRPPAVYGPGDVEMRPVIDLLLRGIILRFGRRTQRIALLHVDDLARAVCAWLISGRGDGGTFALDDGFVGEAGPAYGWHDMTALLNGRRLEIPVPGALLRTLAGVNLQLSRLFGYAPMLTPGKVRELQHERWVCDNSAFTALTGWEPEFGLRRGIATLSERNTP